MARDFDHTLTLSPTENFPISAYAFPENVEKVANLYIADYQRSLGDKLIFGGRTQAIDDMLAVYQLWAKRLGAAEVTLRLLSGLHAHTLVFAGLRKFGNRVLLVPEKAGGHFSTQKMLGTLGFDVIEMPIDFTRCEIDFSATKAIIDSGSIDFIFVDRSEGLNYIDYSSLVGSTKIYSVFDASHYLSNILVKDYKNPFEMGFDLCVATLHKSFPGPQHAIAYTKQRDEQWEAVLDTVRTFVSNIHPAAIYASAFLLCDMPFLRRYSRTSMQNARLLECALADHGIPAIRRDPELPDSYFIFIAINDRDLAFKIFSNLLSVGIETNYRLLPYNLGYGIRLGTNAATILGLKPSDISELAKLFAEGYYNEPTDALRKKVRAYVARIKRERMDVPIWDRKTDWE